MYSCRSSVVLLTVRCDKRIWNSKRVKTSLNMKLKSTLDQLGHGSNLKRRSRMPKVSSGPAIDKYPS